MFQLTHLVLYWQQDADGNWIHCRIVDPEWHLKFQAVMVELDSKIVHPKRLIVVHFSKALTDVLSVDDSTEKLEEIYGSGTRYVRQHVNLKPNADEKSF